MSAHLVPLVLGQSVEVGKSRELRPCLLQTRRVRCSCRALVYGEATYRIRYHDVDSTEVFHALCDKPLTVLCL